jgi:tetratricopeptide (TPR) repeat protein
MVAFSGCAWFSDQGKTEDTLTSVADSQKQELTKQLDRKWANPEAHYQLGKLYHADGLLNKAEYHYRTAIGFDPVMYKAQGSIVKVLADQGDSARSKMAADMYMRQAAVSAEPSLRLGRAFQEEKLDDYAIACYQQAANLAPNSPVVFKQIGYFYLAKGDNVQAEQYLRRSFQLDPYQAEVSGELGRMGVMVQIPRKEANNKKLEKAVQE